MGKFIQKNRSFSKSISTKLFIFIISLKKKKYYLNLTNHLYLLMKTIERNDPCHCGSGKKYKKCCMIADEANKAALLKTDNESHSDEIEPDEVMLGSSGLYSGVFDNVPASNKWNDTASTKAGLPFPEISAEDDAVLEKWYKQAKKIKKPLELLKAAEKFIEEHPALVPAWGFEGEYLLDLKADCVKAGLSKEIFSFLLSFRNRFPEVYQREFGYHDSDLIYFSIANGNISVIPSLLENFEQFPDAFPDKLFEMVNILAVKGESALLFPFLKNIHEKIINSSNIIGGYDILTPIMLHIEGKYLNPDLPDSQYTQMCTEIKETLDVHVDDKFLHEEHWKAEHAIYFSEAGTFSCSMKNKKERNNAYTEFLKKFQWYLYENVTKNWVSAVLISIELSNYIWFTLDQKMVSPNNYFVLDKNIIDRYIAQNLKDYFWINSYRSNALLTSVWYFSEFLIKTGNANLNSNTIVYDACKELHAMEQKINRGNIESAVFNKFPIW
jgi:hypothetical protein